MRTPPEIILPPDVTDYEKLELQFSNSDPRKFLPRKDECAPLIRIMMALSVFLNIKYKDQIERLYFRNGLLGKAIRTLVDRPLEYFEAEKTSSKTILRNIYVPPRVNLRYVASHAFIYAFIATFLMGFIMGCSGVLCWLSWFGSILIFYVAMKMSVEPRDYHKKIYQRFREFRHPL